MHDDASPPHAPTTQETHFRPHSNDPHAMAMFASDAAAALGSPILEPAAVVRAWTNFKGWQGTKPALRWRGLTAWHVEACDRFCHPSLPIPQNIERCPLLRVLVHLSTYGVALDEWAPGTPPPVRDLPKIPYELTEEQHTFARLKHDEFALAGVLRRHSKRETRRVRTEVSSSAFVIDKWKAVRTDAAALARRNWADSDPRTFFAFLCKDKTIRPPKDTFQAKPRVVYDFVSLNASTVRLPMAFHRIEEVAHHIPPGAQLGVIDVKDGFTSVPVALKDVELLRVATKGQSNVTLLRMPFGYALAPFWFCVVSGHLNFVLNHLLQDHGTSAFTYMDDTLLIMPEGRQSGEEDMANSVQVMAEMGLTASSEKLVGPAATLTYRGFELRSTDSKVSIGIPSDKRFALLELLKLIEFPGGSRRDNTLDLPKRLVQSIAGKLDHASSLVPGARARLAGWFRIMRHPRWQFAKAMQLFTISATERSTLQWFGRQLEGDPRLTMSHANIAGAHSENNPHFFGTSDASGEGGIGGYLTVTNGAQVRHRRRMWSIRCPGTTQATELVGQSTRLELIAVLIAVEQARLCAGGTSDTPWVRLTLAVDSQAAVALSRKLYTTSSVALNAVCLRLEAALRILQVALTTVWVPRESNWRADQLSHPEAPVGLWASQPVPQHILELAPPESPAQFHSITYSHILLAVKTLIAEALQLQRMRRTAPTEHFTAYTRIRAIKTSTAKGYINGAAHFLTHAASHGGVTQSVARFVLAKTQAGQWASHNASNNITKLLAALSWLELPRPRRLRGRHRRWLIAAVESSRKSNGRKQRKGKPIESFHKTQADLAGSQPASSLHASLAVAGLWLSFWGIMRPNELWKLRTRHIKVWEGQGDETTFKLRIRDKMHRHRNRVIVVPAEHSWATAAKVAAYRIRNASRSCRLLTGQAADMLRAALRHNNIRPCEIRHSGNTHWIAQGMNDTVRIAQGGWTAKSTIPARHYTTMTKGIAARIRRTMQGTGQQANGD